MLGNICKKKDYLYRDARGRRRAQTLGVIHSPDDVTSFVTCVGLFCHMCWALLSYVSQTLGVFQGPDDVDFNTGTATHCNTLQHTATHCHLLPHTATHCHTLPHNATGCNTLPHTATQRNRLQHTNYADGPRFRAARQICNWKFSRLLNHCSIYLRKHRSVLMYMHTFIYIHIYIHIYIYIYTATHCNALQHTLHGVWRALKLRARFFFVILMFLALLDEVHR